MAKFKIVPASESFETIEAENAIDALVEFATGMDLDMSAYFKAVPVEEQ